MRKPAVSIHVFVALCDNDSQGIVPVPKALGNGEDAASNLYWGALYGTKTFLQKSADWQLVASEKNVSSDVLERVVFRHKRADAYLVADAWRGARIKAAIEGFFTAASGGGGQTIAIGEDKVCIGGQAALVVYVGHNGLMNFSVGQTARAEGSRANDAIVLACKSKPYFGPRLAEMGCRPVLLTTGFMAPEAYTLEAAAAGWLARESGPAIRERAAQAYSRYQKCGLEAARRLFSTE